MYISVNALDVGKNSYSYLDPLSGASSRFQWKLNKLKDHEHVTLRSV